MLEHILSDFSLTTTFKCVFIKVTGFSGGSDSKKNLPIMQETQVGSLGQEDPWRRKWQPTPVFLPGKSQVQRSLAGYSPWAH